MRRWILLLFAALIFIMPICAEEFAPPSVPESGEKYMPDDTQSFGEGLWYVIRQAVKEILPSIAKGAGICTGIVAVMMLLSIFQNLPGSSKSVLSLTGTVMISVILFSSANSLIQLGMNTVTELSEYGKLLLPVMTAATAAQGMPTASAAIYTGTTIFSTILIGFITQAVIPVLYIYLTVSIANSALREDILKNFANLTKWLVSWGLKLVIYVFTGYLTLTGVVSGTADATAVKALKMTISGTVPIVGGMISEASETILVSAALMKNAAGVYGILALLAVLIGPFLEIGVHYLMLKLCGAVCSLFGSEAATQLVQDFSGAMGMLLGMTGTVCLLLLIAVVCFMKGAAI